VRIEGTSSVGCPGLDGYGTESPPYGGGDSLGVLREPPLETW
jgi:hypothetical protein